jgi:hypothetical protein
MLNNIENLSIQAKARRRSTFNVQPSMYFYSREVVVSIVQLSTRYGPGIASTSNRRL